MFSIRRFLLVYLLLMVIITTVITSIGNFFLDKRDIQNHLDALLSEAHHSVQVILNTHYPKVNQYHPKPSTPKKVLTTEQQLKLLSMGKPYEVQVWNKQNKLLFKTGDIPETPLSTLNDGFSNLTINGIKWRTYTKKSDHSNLVIIVAEKLNVRTLLSRRLLIDDIYIMLITYPIAGLLIWVIVGFGLRSIKRVTDEVSHRLPTYLEPVNAKNVPSEIKPLVTELNKLFNRLQQALEREKRFAADAAHELRTPLAALRTQTQVAIKADTEMERKQLLKNIILGVDRCTHVVQQLLTMSRLVPEANKLNSDLTVVDLPKLAAEILAQLATQALEKNIDIELLAKHHQLTIKGNITALSILIRNLVDNAIRYTSKGGKVSVSVTQQGQQIIFKVTDNGPGIPAELQSRVFERFFRVLGNKSPGSGLGLAIVEQISQLHDATVELGTPTSGQGLEVTITFPKSS